MLALPVPSFKERISPPQHSVNRQLESLVCGAVGSKVLQFDDQNLGKCCHPYENFSPCRLFWCFQRNQRGNCPQLVHSLAAGAQEGDPNSKCHPQEISHWFLVIPGKRRCFQGVPSSLITDCVSSESCFQVLAFPYTLGTHWTLVSVSALWTPFLKWNVQLLGTTAVCAFPAQLLFLRLKPF